MITLIKFHSPRFFQIFGFLCLVPSFLAAGLVLVLLRGDITVYPAAIIYVLAYGVFEVGPNFTMFMLPAEIFPTRRRAIAHGIAAASGKLGANLYQIYFPFVKFHNGGRRYAASDASTKWLGFTVLCFIPTMLAGALVAWILVPPTREDGGRTNLSLDELEKLGNQSIWGDSIVMVRLVKMYEMVRNLLMGCWAAVSGKGGGNQNNETNGSLGIPMNGIGGGP
jgi:PHS family inorganic phosphate transporter-like MFS transporter